MCSLSCFSSLVYTPRFRSWVGFPFLAINNTDNNTTQHATRKTQPAGRYHGPDKPRTWVVSPSPFWSCAQNIKSHIKDFFKNRLEQNNAPTQPPGLKAIQGGGFPPLRATKQTNTKKQSVERTQITHSHSVVIRHETCHGQRQPWNKLWVGVLVGQQTPRLLGVHAGARSQMECASDQFCRVRQSSSLAQEGYHSTWWGQHQ